jgi:hypothetical protein
MPDNMLDLIIARYLRGGVNVRGALHESVPTESPAIGTPSTANTLPATLGVSFVPLTNQIGSSPTTQVTDSSVLWAQHITEILGDINDTDQAEIVAKYGKMTSMLIDPRGVVPGFFYTFRYEAKTVDAYDSYPLMLALKKDSKGIFGMNFHYLPPKLRFALFEAMMPLIVPLPVQQMSLIYLTYEKLKRRRMVGKYPTLKRYSFGQIKSRVVFISPLEWAVALAYPSERFMYTTQTRVWNESRKHLKSL